MRMKRNILIISLISIVSGCYNSSNVDIDIWVPENKSPKITIKKDIDYWNKKGYHEGTCGWMLSVNVSILPPPNSTNYIYGTEKFFEYDSSGNIIAQWAAPANSYPIAVKDDLIFTNGGLGVASDGKLKSIVYEKQNIIHTTCPENLDVDNSDYLRCAIFVDSPLLKGRHVAYNAPCT